MTRVFLSFASEDAAVAKRFATFWAALGVEVFRFDAPDRRPGRVVEEIERQLREADLFVVLLSPHYLGSGWCRQERDLAFQREITMGRLYVHVGKVAETVPGDAGLLANYHWLDATGELTDQRLSEISTQLRLERGAGAAVPDVGAVAEIPGFRNRDDELANLSGALRTPGGRDLWVVVSPPLMGKSWLLARLEQKLTGVAPHWAVRHLDLRHAPAELRTNPTRLVGSLLNVDTSSPQGPLLDDDLRKIAAQLSVRKSSQLFVLDSAELVRALTEISPAISGVSCLLALSSPGGGGHGVVPVAVKLVSLQVDGLEGLHLLVGDLDAARVGVRCRARPGYSARSWWWSPRWSRRPPRGFPGAGRASSG